MEVGMDRQIRPEDVEPSEVTARLEAELAEAKLRTFEHARRQEVAKPTDQQVQEAAESLRNIPELRPEAWQRLDDSHRLQVMQEVEQRMAAIQGRPLVRVVAEPMERGVCGGYRQGDKTIHISQEHLRSNNAREVLDTVVHEGRHAYQHYAITHPGFHPDQAQVRAWAENLRPGHYIRGGRVPGAYMRQPVEADAWVYAGRIVRQVMGGAR
jgi:hypothetical protein